MKSAGELYEEAMVEGERLIDDIRFRGVKTEKAAKRLDKILNKIDRAWIKVTAKK